MMKKKVLFIIWSFSAGGGAEKVLANLVNKMDKNQYDIDILEYENFDYKIESLENHINLLNPVNINSKSNRINNKFEKYFHVINSKINKLYLLFFPVFLRKKVLKEMEGKYDIEIGFNYLIPSFMISKSKKAKKILWIHSSIEDLDCKKNNNFRTKILYKKQKKAFDKIDKIVAISKKTENSIVDLYPEYSSKLIRIYNGYDFENILNLAHSSCSYKKEKFCIIGAGRLTSQKNFSLLIEVAKILRERDLQFEIIILGEGEERSKLQKEIFDKKLEEYINLMGYIENPYPYFLQADLFCMTSIAEGFPTVLVEAMALGCPFISTPVAGTEELSAAGKCGIVTSYNPINIAEQIEYFILNSKNLEEMRNNCIHYSSKYKLITQVDNVQHLINGFFVEEIE